MVAPLTFARRVQLALIASATAVSCAGALQQKPLLAQEQAPNIIFIMADDQGYTDLGCYGSAYYETPHIDKLASQGLKLTNHHHCQNCTPTRAALLSGQYGPRTGVYTVGNIDRFDWSQRPLRPVDNVTQLPLDRSIFPNQLQIAGYTTGVFGKWHVGEQGPYHPGRRGFTEAIVAAGKHFDFKTNPAAEYPPDTYLADFLTDQAEGFIRKHRDERFFLYLPHFGVHSPYQAKREYIEKFQAKAPAEGHRDPVYAAMIYSIDESVGRITELLDELKLTEKTLVVFTSDNGGVGGYVREGIKSTGDVTDNAPLRSGKGSLYEGGTRVPFIVRWPGRIPEGVSVDQPTIHVDIYPTMLELANAPAPEHVLDGESLLPVWLDPSKSLHREAIYQHFPGYLGAGANKWRTTPVSLIHKGDWKLLEFLEDGRLELYNLADDIGETNNLVTTHAAKRDELHAQLTRWRQEIKAPMPTENDGSSKPSKRRNNRQNADADD